MQTSPVTKVIFRKYPDAEILALFPEECGTNDPYTCSCYARIGQHGSADPVGVIHSTKAAKSSEYGALKGELERIGYVLSVKARMSHQTALNARKTALARIVA